MRRHILGLQLHQNLLRLCNPGVDSYSDTLVGLVDKVLEEVGDKTVLGECAYTLESQEDIIRTFQDCLQISIRSSDSVLLRDIPAGYQLVSLVLQKGEQETPLVDRLLELDGNHRLWRIIHQQKSSTWTEVKVFKTFPSGHFLCYLGRSWREKLGRMEEKVLYNLSRQELLSKESLRPGTMGLVRAESMSLDEPSAPKYRAARGIIVSEPNNGCVRLYLPDYGVQGSAPTLELRRAPEECIFSVPILTFCRLQVS